MMTTTNNNFEDGALYHGEIVDQMLSQSMDGDLQAIFAVRMTAKVVGSEASPCDPFERDIFVTFAEDETRRKIAHGQIKRLGFTDPDLSRLHPDHPQAASMVGKRVMARAKVKGESTYWNFAWERPKPLDLAAAQAAAAKLAGLKSPSNGTIPGQSSLATGNSASSPTVSQ